MQLSLSVTMITMSAIHLYASPILIKPPRTDAGDKVRIDIRIKDSDGNIVKRSVSTTSSPHGENTSAENAGELAKAINQLGGDNFKASVVDGQLKLSPGGDSLGGIDGEPTYYYDETLNRLLNLLFSQTLIPDNQRGEEIGFGRLDWIAGTARGGGQVSFSVGSFTATSDTFAGETSFELLGSLAAQVSGARIPVHFDGTSLTAFSYDGFSVSHTDAGFSLGFSGGTAAVPEAPPSVLLGLGLVLISTLLRRCRTQPAMTSTTG